MTRRSSLNILFWLILSSPTGALAADWAVQPQVIEDRKAVLASVASKDLTLARTRIGGTIRELLIDEGSQVKAGEKLALVVDPKLPLRLNAIDARLKSLAAQRELAQTELDRARELRTRGAVSQARLDQAQTALDVVIGEIAALQAERAVVAQQLKEGEVLAPEGGRVLKKAVTLGSVVQPGETVAEIAADVFILRMQVPERHARFIKVGDKVLVGPRGLEFGEDGLREGTVRQVYPELDKGRVVADVAVAGLGDFFVGERTRVWVTANRRETILVPPEFIRYRFGLTYVVLKDGTEVAVQTGAGRDGGVEILSGLKAGDVLVRP